jgi:hypothetical protein
MMQQAVEHRTGKGQAVPDGGVPSADPAFTLVLISMKIAPRRDMGLLESSPATLSTVASLNVESSVAKGGFIFLAS